MPPDGVLVEMSCGEIWHYLMPPFPQVGADNYCEDHGKVTVIRVTAAETPSP